MATHSSILAWRIPWTEGPGGLQSVESQRVRHDRVINTFTFFLLITIFLKFIHVVVCMSIAMESLIAS